MKTNSDYTFFRSIEDDENFVAIATSEIKREALYFEVLQMKPEFSMLSEAHAAAEDYSIWNEYSTARADMIAEGVKVFGDAFTKVDYSLDMDESFCIDNAEEMNLEDREEEMIQFIGNWEDAHAVYNRCDFFEYYDGQKFVPMLLDSDYNGYDVDAEVEVLYNGEDRELAAAMDHLSWEKDIYGNDVSYYGGVEVKKPEGSYQNSYELRVLDADERMELAQIEGSYLTDETTSDRSGYPEDLKKALFGFDTFEEAEEVAEKYGLQISEFYSKDGWQFKYRCGKAHGPLEQNTCKHVDNENWVIGLEAMADK